MVSMPAKNGTESAAFMAAAWRVMPASSPKISALQSPAYSILRRAGRRLGAGPACQFSGAGPACQFSGTGTPCPHACTGGGRAPEVVCELPARRPTRRASAAAPAPAAHARALLTRRRPQAHGAARACTGHGRAAPAARARGRPSAPAARAPGITAYAPRHAAGRGARAAGAHQQVRLVRVAVHKAVLVDHVGERLRHLRRRPPASAPAGALRARARRGRGRGARASRATSAGRTPMCRSAARSHTCAASSMNSMVSTRLDVKCGRMTGTCTRPRTCARGAAALLVRAAGLPRGAPVRAGRGERAGSSRTSWVTPGCAGSAPRWPPPPQSPAPARTPASADRRTHTSAQRRRRGAQAQRTFGRLSFISSTSHW